MKIITQLFLLCCISLLVSHCGSPERKKHQLNDTEIDKTEQETLVTNREAPIEAEGETKNAANTNLVSQQKASPGYSSFVPSRGVQGSKMPAILFFDPHASGMVPVEMYKSLAEEFGYVLLGSNRSHNGQTLDEAFAIFEKLKSEAIQSFPVDESQVYVAGFSGGSRVAAAVGGKYPDIKSVIACGAGIGAVQHQPAPTFDYFGIIGNEDFSLNEMISTDRMLKRAGFNNAMVIYDGGHYWPPVEVMREAFWWLDLNAMKNKTRPLDQKIAADASNWYKKEILRLKNAGRFFDAGLVAERAAKSLKGVANIQDFENEIKLLRSQPDYQKQLAEVVTTMQKEMGLQNSYISAMAEKDTTWWKSEIRRLQDSTVTKNDRLINKRMLSYLGLLAYMFSDQAVNEQNIESAGKYLEIYRLLEPTNSEHFFLEARRRMLMKDTANAIAFLRLAMVFGFSDLNRIKSDPLFEPLKNNPDFKELVR